MLLWSVEAKKEGKTSDTEAAKPAKDAAPKDKKIDKKKAEKRNVGAFIYTGGVLRGRREGLRPQVRSVDPYISQIKFFHIC